jgi:hypothetical protein
VGRRRCRQQLDRQHVGGGRFPHRCVSGSASVRVRARAGPLFRVERGHRRKHGSGPRVHRRRRAGRRSLARRGGRSAARRGTDRLHRRSRAPDLGSAAPGVAGRRPRRLVGHDRDSRLRPGAVHVRGTQTRASRREHGSAARSLQSDRPVQRAPRPLRRAAPRPGSSGVPLTLARGGRARAVRAGDGRRPPRAGGPPHQVLLPPLVVRQRRLARAARSTAPDDGARCGSDAGAARRGPARLHVAFGGRRRARVADVGLRRGETVPARNDAVVLRRVSQRASPRVRGLASSDGEFAACGGRRQPAADVRPKADAVWLWKTKDLQCKDSSVR